MVLRPESVRHDGCSNDRLIDAVRCILETASVSLSEYQLIQYLNDQGWSLTTSAADSLALFTSHFLVYNALYRLQISYLEQGCYLEISAVSIKLQESHDCVWNSTSLSEEAALDRSLQEYYLDFGNLENATEASVNTLLNQFWERFVTGEESEKAFQILSLNPPITLAEVKQRYRVLAMKYHPDRGGDSADFQAINWAFGVLQRFLTKI